MTSSFHKNEVFTKNKANRILKPFFYEADNNDQIICRFQILLYIFLRSKMKCYDFKEVVAN